ncbi:uncharacterized protein JCM6883_004656 [Sporobolomyces salmoneus]|uniref:uncharacterized protein n=1 Tax=Sporobolomyces salmoneus TaxID=183962 RepID=UPI0031742FAE
MPLPVAIHAALNYSDLVWQLTKWGGAITTALTVRSYSKGYVCCEEKELAGKTYMLSGGFSGVGLEVLQFLAAQRSQVIALHPDPTSASVVQLLMLLRSTSSNERIYVEQCDLSSIDSIKCFIQKWQRDAKSGMVQDLEARIDGIIFCDGDGAGEEGSGYGVRAQKMDQVGTEETIEKRHATHLTGRHALVQLLLPTLLRSASTATSPIRIINQVSPFYSAVVPSTFVPLDLDFSTRPFPSKAPWIAEGQVALASVLLWREFQSRLELTSSTSSTNKKDPATSTTTALPSDALPTSSPILALSVCPGLTRSYIRQTLRASTTHPHFSPIGLAIYLLVLPLIWLFAKSASEGSQVVLGALMADTVAEGERGKKKKKRVKTPEGILVDDEEEPGKRGERRMWVRGGALYREGLVVRLPILENLPPTTANELWEAESKRVEGLLAASVQHEKATKDKEDSSAEAATKGKGD